MEELKQILSIIQLGIIKTIMLESFIILLAYFLVCKKYKNHLMKWRIQSVERINDKQIYREFKNAIYTLLVSLTFTCIVIYLNQKGYTKVYNNFYNYSILWGFLSFFILLIIDDTWFYWYHRFLHIPKVFKNIHFEHHKSFDVNPISSLSFHFIEPFFLNFWIIPIIFIIPIHSTILYIVIIISILNNVKSHLGYEFYPNWWNKSILGFITSSTHHNMHHSKINGNYGAHFRIWDNFMGTEFKDYETVFNSVQERKLEK